MAKTHSKESGEELHSDIDARKFQSPGRIAGERERGQRRRLSRHVTQYFPVDSRCGGRLSVALVLAPITGGLHSLLALSGVRESVRLRKPWTPCEIYVLRRRRRTRRS